MTDKNKKIKIFKTQNNVSPFLKGLQDFDKMTQKAILKAIEKSLGASQLMGDWKFLQNGVYELRFFIGSGQRVYFATDTDGTAILLTCGTKGTQKQDIKKAIEYLKDYQASKASQNDYFSLEQFQDILTSRNNILPHPHPQGSLQALNHMIAKIKQSAENFSNAIQESHIEVRRLSGLLQSEQDPENQWLLEGAINNEKKLIIENEKKLEVAQRLAENFSIAAREWEVAIVDDPHTSRDALSLTSEYRSLILQIWQKMAEYNSGEILDFDMDFELLQLGIDLTEENKALLSTNPTEHYALAAWQYVADGWLIDSTSLTPLNDVPARQNPVFRSLLYQKVKFTVFLEFLESITSLEQEKFLEQELYSFSDQELMDKRLAEFADQISDQERKLIAGEFKAKYRQELKERMPEHEVSKPLEPAQPVNDTYVYIEFLKRHFEKLKAACESEPYSPEERLKLLKFYGLLRAVSARNTSESVRSFLDGLYGWREEFEALYDFTLHSHKIAYENLKKQLEESPYDPIYTAQLRRFHNKTAEGLVRYANHRNRAAREAWAAEVKTYKDAFEIKYDTSLNRLQKQYDHAMELLTGDPFNLYYRRYFSRLVANSNNVLRFDDHPNFKKRKAWHKTLIKNKQDFENKYDIALKRHQDAFDALMVKIRNAPYDPILRDHLQRVANGYTVRLVSRANSANKAARKAWQQHVKTTRDGFVTQYDSLLNEYQARFDFAMQQLESEPYNPIYRAYIQLLCGSKTASGALRGKNEALNAKRKEWFETAIKMKESFEAKHDQFIHESVERINFLLQKLENDHYHEAYRVELEKLVRALVTGMKKRDMSKVEEGMSQRAQEIPGIYDQLASDYSIRSYNSNYEYPENCEDQKLYKFQATFEQVKIALTENPFDTAYITLLRKIASKVKVQLMNRPQEGNVEARTAWVNEFFKWKADFDNKVDLSYIENKNLVDMVKNLLKDDQYNPFYRHYYSYILNVVWPKLVKHANGAAKDKRQEYRNNELAIKEAFDHQYDEVLKGQMDRFELIQQGFESGLNLESIEASFYILTNMSIKGLSDSANEHTLLARQAFSDQVHTYKQERTDSQDELLSQYVDDLNALKPQLEEVPYNLVLRANLMRIVTGVHMSFKEHRSQNKLLQGKSGFFKHSNIKIFLRQPLI